ncbi:hypothetical protein [Krasilnikovia sp. M28-CT-15]|uniref:hypothetical protein n=1 Tax=Krasilnikovia sp. M28-CT-15 TaxID=3373540 RepID=UPI00399C69FC
MGLVGLLVAGLAAGASSGCGVLPSRDQNNGAAGGQSQEPAASRPADAQADTAMGANSDTSADQPKASDGPGAGTASNELAPSAADLPSDGLGAGHVGRQGVLEVEAEDAAAPGQELPDNYKSAVNAVGGYAIGLSTPRKAYAVGPTTFVESDDTMIEANFEVHSYESVDPWARLTQDEKLFAKEHAEDQYKKVKMSQRWTYRGKPAVMWEFTWTRNGERAHGRQIAFRDGPRTYTVLYRSADTWWLNGGSQSYPVDFEQAFTPLSR